MQLWTLSDCCSNWNITEIEYLVNSAYTGTCTLPSFSGISKKWNGIRKWTCSYYYQFWCLSSFINNNVAILVSSMAEVTNPGPSPVKDKHGDLPLTSVIHDCVHSVQLKCTFYLTEIQLKIQVPCLHLHRTTTKETALCLFFKEVIHLHQRPLKSVEIFSVTSVSCGYSSYWPLSKSNNLMMLIFHNILLLTENLILKISLHKDTSQDQRIIYYCSHVFHRATNCW